MVTLGNQTSQPALPMSLLRSTALGLILAVCVNSSFAQLSVPNGARITLPAGSHTDQTCTSLNVDGTLSLAAATVEHIGGLRIGSTGRLHVGAGTLEVSGDWNNIGTFIPGTGSVVLNDDCIAGPIRILGKTTFNNLTLTGDNTEYLIGEGAEITIQGTLRLQGASGKPVQLASENGKETFIRLGPTARFEQIEGDVADSIQFDRLTPQNISPIPTLTGWPMAALIGLLMLISFPIFNYRKKY